MPEVEIEDYETKHVTREGYACDKCGKGAVDEPLGEDEIVTVLYQPGAHDRLTTYNDDVHRQFRCDEHADVRQKIEYETDVKERMERYKEIITFTARLGSSVLLLAGIASATAIAALLFEVANPGFVTNPELAGMQWLLATFFILVGSMVGGGIIWWLEDNS